MPTTVTCARLLDAAEHLFAELGYRGASLRAITAAAGADLGSVRYHFGSKAALFTAVLRRRLGPTTERRLEALDALEAEAGERPCELEDLLEAFTTPAFELLTHPEHGRDWGRLVARARVEPEPFLAAVADDFPVMLERYLTAVCRALPGLEAREVHYRWHFFFGAQVNTLTDAVSLEFLGDQPGVMQDPQGVQRRLIEFCAAGFRHERGHDL